MRFLGLGLEDKVPDAKTVLALPGTVGAGGRDRDVVRGFRRLSGAAGLLGDGRPDSSTPRGVPVPKQRNSGDDNARIKEGETPEGWENQPAKRSQKDTDARWTKKHGKSHRRLQEPRQRGPNPQAQAGAALPSDGQRRCTTARLWMTFSIRTTRPRRCGRTAPIGRRRSRRILLKEKGLQEPDSTARGIATSR